MDYTHVISHLRLLENRFLWTILHKYALFWFYGDKQIGAFQICCYVIGAHEYFGMKWDSTFIWTNSSRWYIIKNKSKNQWKLVLDFLKLCSLWIGIRCNLFLYNKEEIGRGKLLFYQFYLLISLTQIFNNFIGISILKSWFQHQFC